MRSTPPVSLKAIPIMAALWSLPWACVAGGLGDFNAAVEAVHRHQQAARFYFHTRNPLVAGFELERLRARWQALAKRFGEAPPDAFAADGGWAATLDQVAERYATAAAAADSGDAAAGARALGEADDLLRDLRRRNGVWVFSDRMAELDAALERLYRYRHDPPDLDALEAVNEVKAAAAVATYLVGRCRRDAPAAIGGDAEFRRLTAESLESITRLIAALDRRDPRAVIGNLRELRSFQGMLALKFG